MLRMKELENQTYEVDEHYQRYLKTHYRNLENQRKYFNFSVH